MGKPTDLNDLMRMEGEGAVRACIEAASPAEQTRQDPAASSNWPPPVDLAKLSGTEPAPPKFIMSPWLPCGYATLLAGHGGVGKSGIALMLAVCIAMGLAFFGISVERRRVLYLSCEDREGVLHWRLNRICTFLGITLADLSGWLDIIDLVGHETILYQPKRDASPLTWAYQQLAMRMKQGSQVLMVDGISDTYDGNENARAEVKAYINALLALVHPDEGAVILVGHVSKPAANTKAAEGYSGSTGWHNSVRARWYLRPEQKILDEGGSAERTGDLVMELQKSNLGPTDGCVRFTWDEAAGLFVGQVDQGETHFDRNYRNRQEQDAILSAIVSCPVDIPAATQGQRTAFKVLSLQPGFPHSIGASKPDRDRFWRHLEALRQIGMVEESTIRRANRHHVAVLVPTSKATSACVDASNTENTYSAHMDADATASMRRNRQGVYKGVARAHSAPEPECPQLVLDPNHLAARQSSQVPFFDIEV